MIEWTKQQAQEFLFQYHGINSTYASSIKEIFNKLQVVQYDPLNVVGTNSELVMQARLQSFKATQLYDALYKERYLIDAWDRQMSIVLTKDFPLLQPVREQRAEMDRNGTIKYRGFDPLDYEEEILSKLRETGPLYAKDIKTWNPIIHTWGSSKPSTATLDYLFFKGDIGVSGRNNTQKQYDLIERLIPNSNDPYPYDSQETFLDDYLLRRIRACGLIWARHTVYYGMFIHHTKTRQLHLKRLVEQGRITEVKIEGIKDVFYVPTEYINQYSNIVDRISFLAPLDNMIWDRDLLKELFDFDYIWEVYTPLAKRKYGYYVLPMVRGTSFIGRIEFSKQRGNEPLEILSIQYEESIQVNKTLESKLQQALKKFANYLGASAIIYP